MPANIAAHLLSVLRDNSLYASIRDLDSKEIAELSIALQRALTVAKYEVYARCHPAEESQS